MVSWVSRLTRKLGRLWQDDQRAGMSSSALYEQLHEALFPGEPFSAGRVHKLAGRLRQIADELQRPSPDAIVESRPLPKDLNFTDYQQRYVALQLLYIGHDYDGFARQDTTTETIEEHLFAALRKTRLVPFGANWRDFNYSRGGRTDKGVSALGQVVALMLRSKGRAGDTASPVSEEEELDYPMLLNAALPPAIRVLGWTTAPADFSARFSAKFREYKYFIMDREGNLDVEKMRTAASFLVGQHDFRNFCKADVAAVKSFVRDIKEVQLREVEGLQWGERRVLELYIRGTAFLWHQVRCMASVLLLVGSGLEDPSVVQELLDLEHTPRKPQYSMASEEPLLLYSCSYGDLSFRRSNKVYEEVLRGMDKVISSHLIRAALVHTMEGKSSQDEVYEVEIRKRRAIAKYIPLLDRPKEPSIDERLQRLASAQAAIQLALPVATQD